MVAPICIGDRQIGPDRPCFIIAEVGVNHDGRMDQARDLVDAATAVGADAVKFQTFKADALVARGAPKAAYQRRSKDDAESQSDMLKRLELSYDQFRELHEYCHLHGILFLSTPFDEQAADFLDTLGMPAFKIGSGEITNLPLLAHVAKKGKPILLSTGMSRLEEVEAAVGTIRDHGHHGLALLHCIGIYPAPAEDVNLRAMHTLATAFGVPVGYSDHTVGTEIALAAVALGACIIEKHLTLNRLLPGPDHQASIEPAEFGALVRGIRRVEMSLGDGLKVPTSRELETAAVARRSLVAAKDILAGTVLTDELIAIRRPGTGLPPALKPSLIGRATRVDIPAGDLIALEMLS